MDAARILNMARRKAGLTQRGLSLITGVPQPSISRIERGVVTPTVDMLERLIRACGMELEPIDRPGEADVDRTLIDARLRMTPAERVRRVELEWLRTEPFRHARPVAG